MRSPIVLQSCPCTLRALALVFALAGSAATALAQTAVTDFSAGPGTGKYSFSSSTPKTLLEVMDPSKPRPAATAQGELMLPVAASASARVPAVVLVHGSGGVYPELMNFWGKRFNDQGIAAFVIDVFGPRGVKSTGEDQSQVPFTADLADAFAALKLLATHPAIDRDRIAVMGFSRGGITAWRANVNRIASGLSPDGVRFAAHVALYSGGCAGTTSVSAKSGVFGTAPMLFVHGEEDDYTYASDCKDYAARIAATGTPAEFVPIAGARHKFDADDSRRIQLASMAKTRPGCPAEFDVNALTYRDRRSDVAIGLAQYGAFYRENCAAQGASVEGNQKARGEAATAVDAFLRKAFRM